MQVEVEVPIDYVWSLWSDLEQMPKWMKWIDAVKIPEDDPEISIWTLKSGIWEFNWKSRIVKVIPHQIIEWESIDGLPNRGAIRFYDRHGSSIVKLTIAYAIPGVLRIIMDNLFLRNIVESTIQADMNRFRDYALQRRS
ncbi:Oligoketide cyclase/lipid transport protein homolog [Richelia intracellularis]|nr:Oligoketide cyclase/lipid transport protein homolog [Richelia intracellularis]